MPGLLVAAFGALMMLVGVLGWRGVLLRGPSWYPLTNYGGIMVMGAGLAFAGLTATADEGSPLAMALAFPAALFSGFGVWCMLVRTPRWARPAWQRDSIREE